MKKTLKAFTLIELIVVIAILGILMAGIMRMYSPVQSLYSDSQAISNSQSVENAIAGYIVNNTRNATNLWVYTDMASADAAIQDFLDKGPSVVVKDTTTGSPTYGRMIGRTAVKEDIYCICVNHATDYTVDGNAVASNNKAFRGRLVSKVKGSTASCSETQSAFKYDGTSGSYMVFGSAYYGTADYFVKLDNISASGMEVSVRTEYYPTKSKNVNSVFRKGNGTFTENVSTRETVKFANNGVPRIVNDAVQIFGAQDTTASPSITTPKNYYIVYTLD